MPATFALVRGLFGLATAPRQHSICRDNGIDHLLTAPRSPTTTGRIERWHKTLRTEFLNGKVFVSITEAQAQLDRWVDEYNHQRPHQSIGGAPPFERFKLAPPAQSAERSASAQGTGTTTRAFWRLVVHADRCTAHPGDLAL